MAEVETYGEEVLPVESEATLTVAQPAELPEIKLFGRWSCDDVQVSDMSLQVGWLCLEVKVSLIDVVKFTSCRICCFAVCNGLTTNLNKWDTCPIKMDNRLKFGTEFMRIVWLLYQGINYDAQITSLLYCDMMSKFWKVFL